MRNWKRILAGIGTAALLLSSVGAVPRVTFAAETGVESTASEIEEIDLQTIGTVTGGSTGGASTGTESGGSTGGTSTDAAGNGLSVDSSASDAASDGAVTNGGVSNSSERGGSVGDTSIGSVTNGSTGGTSTDAAGNDSSADGTASGSASDGTSTNGGASTGSETGGTTGDTSTGSETNGSTGGASTDTASGGSSASDTTTDSTDGNTQTANGASNTGTDTPATDEPGTGDDVVDGTDYADLFGDGTSMASISGGPTVEIGDTIQLSCSDCRSGYWSRGTKTWTSSDESIATFNGGTDTSRPSLLGVARGTVTITHTHADRYGNTQNSTYEVTVKAQNESDAIIYALKTPDSDPDSNDGTQWTGALGIGSVNATDADFNGGKNITNNPQQYMVSWPDGREGKTWTLTSSMTGTSKTYFESVRKEIFSAYSAELKDVLGITDITEDNIKNITLTPYKISHNNGSDPDMHVDCKISITCEKTYDVKFWVKDVGATDYVNTYSVTDTYVMTIKDTTPQIQRVVEPDAEDTLGYRVGDTKVVDGVTYRMTGWHPEDATTHNTPGSKTVDLTGEGYEPIYEEELYDDNVANYYAEWEALTGDLVVTKAVTGDTGYVDPNGKYQIVIHLDGDENRNRDYGTYHFDGNGNCIVTLADGESVNIIGIISGTGYTVTEAEDSRKGFTVSYDTTYYQLDESGNKVTVTDVTDGTIYPEGTADVTVSNERSVVLTGVMTDTAPWISLITVFVMALAGAGLYQGARRHYTR